MMSVPLIELRNGDLYADPGGPVPDVPAGYVRDLAEAHRLHLTVTPGACAKRTEKKCASGAVSRLWCSEKGVVNPGACCRCQGLTGNLTQAMEAE